MYAHVSSNQTAFTTQKDFGKEVREAQWAAEQRTLHGLRPAEPKAFTDRSTTFRDINLMAEEARRRAEIARSVIFNFKLHQNTTLIKLALQITLLIS